MAAQWNSQRGWFDATECERKAAQAQLVASLTGRELEPVPAYAFRLPGDAGFCESCGIGHGHNRSV